ncbi:hypothetical protein ACQKM2_15815 [Streptomyces sp. NPDC004126]
MPWINTYVKSDGTKVGGHFRLPPGARPEPTVSYPIVFPSPVGGR